MPKLSAVVAFEKKRCMVTSVQPTPEDLFVCIEKARHRRVTRESQDDW